MLYLRMLRHEPEWSDSKNGKLPLLAPANCDASLGVEINTKISYRLLSGCVGPKYLYCVGIVQAMGLH